MKKYLIPYLNIQKFCPVSNQCSKIERKSRLGEGVNPYNGIHPTRPSLILNDGTYVYLWLVTGITLMIDINGDKRPNRYGRDVFLIEYNTNNTVDFGYRGNYYTRERLLSGCIGPNPPITGSTCGALILKDDWQIKDDYPW